MIWALAFALWITLAAGLYLALSRDVVRIVIGLGLLGSAVNLALLGSGRLEATQPAFIAVGAQALGTAANPVPQALVLTAIVIGLALMCFSLLLVVALVRRAVADDVRALRWAEPPADDPVQPPWSADESLTP
jgi:multicomponent Na+:H+ antiporter subunit C